MMISTQSLWTIFLVFLRLGLTSFGGPTAHLGYFRDEFVIRRKWLNDAQYADTVALCQFLPGPASSQVGMAIGYYCGGYKGALVAWLGFTFPSAMILISFALGFDHLQSMQLTGILHGLKIIAVAVVIQALWGMTRTLCPDATRITLMSLSTFIMLMLPSLWTQLVVIIVAGILGTLIFRSSQSTEKQQVSTANSRHIGFTGLILFFGLLIALPVLSFTFSNPALAIFDAFYRTGALVFGGGHVVLPLLNTQVVTTGWIEQNTFLAGYSLAQAVPGPLFTFAGFLGASMPHMITPWLGGILCIVAIFSPSFFLLIGILPFWQSIRDLAWMIAALKGINAAVVGLLLAALYQPIWTNSIYTSKDFSLALLALLALMVWRLPVWLVVFLGGLLGWWFM